MIKDNLPKYILDLKKKYPQIISGRKNFNIHNSRIKKILKIIRRYYKKTNN